MGWGQGKGKWRTLLITKRYHFTIKIYKKYLGFNCCLKQKFYNDCWVFKNYIG
ncbi:hypothetical protein [Moraxella lacunata]|uniref:hypothetical protein n=1 Tax=Moraxella lacunata TaxID=477 RepID=UPI003EE01DBD